VLLRRNRSRFTRRDDLVHLFLVARPQGFVTVRGVPVKRVRKVTVMGSGVELGFTTRAAVLDQVMPDPNGEVVIDVPDGVLDPTVTVLTIEMADAPIGRPVLGRWGPE
jgi:alpha-L-fucosidase